MSLVSYKKKRDFAHTSEPEGRASSSGEEHLFVVQRHAASRLHYDFRLEMEGVLKSWAVPKGPSLNPADKRLAVMVEDHPYDYHSFEGTIAKGNYGAGEVEIWDSGTYEPLQRKEGRSDDETLLEELSKGSVKIRLHGKKLKGEFALVKMRSAKEENAWLLIKHNDANAVQGDYDAENDRSSVKKKKKSAGTDSIPERSRKHYLSGQKKLEKYIRPMLATTMEEPLDGDEWIYEIKWDGYRAIADLRGGLQLYSRNGLSFLGKYHAVEAALKQQQHEMILDGEIVAYNKEGKPDFQMLQHYDDNPQAPIVYQVFDLLYLNGHSTRELTLLQRKELLREALTETDHVKYSDHVENSGSDFFIEIEKNDLEGMMMKKKSGTYAEGARSGTWVKVKNHKREEAVIVGYTEPRGSRSYFGSLILGRYSEGVLRYAGHVGTGFKEKELKEIYTLLQPMVTDKMPFGTRPVTNAPPTWVRPEMVCTVKYTRITEDGLFRHPVFIGIREDISAADLRKEMVKSDTQPPRKKKNAASSSPTNEKATFTNTGKYYWKKEKITKGELIDYYLSVSDYILPHLQERAQSLHRFPDGVEGQSFYHKDAGQDAPSWVETVRIHSESGDKELEYIVCNNRETLGYLINLGCIELNPWNNRTANPDKPDYLVIDLDPSDKNSFKQVVEAARVTKELLDIAQVPAYCKTSGSTGIHIYVPLGAEYSYEQGRDFAHIVMQLVERRLPDSTTLERSLSKRGARIYLDYLQNRKGQTVASVYSVRPKPGAPVSMPLEWDELTDELSIRDFTMHNALDRLTRKGDIFLPVLHGRTDLNIALSRLQDSQ
jgi:bifunctional non-homologous end joining protein LigD